MKWKNLSTLLLIVFNEKWATDIRSSSKSPPCINGFASSWKIQTSPNINISLVAESYENSLLVWPYLCPHCLNTCNLSSLPEYMYLLHASRLTVIGFQLETGKPKSPKTNHHSKILILLFYRHMETHSPEKRMFIKKKQGIFRSCMEERQDRT